MTSDGLNTSQRANLRTLDTSWRNLAIELFRAIAGLLGAFVLTEFIAVRAGWNHSAGGYLTTGAIFVFAGLSALYATSGRPIQQALLAQREDIARREDELRATSARHRFTSEVQTALDMAETEADAVAVVGRAFSAVHDGPAELLLADSSRAHLIPVAASAAGAPGCDVPSPWSCPAVRSGHSLTFDTNRNLAACPRLASRQDDVSALCVPVTILGTPMGVIHMTGEAGEVSAETKRPALESIAIQAGTRVGVLRAMASSELAATTDPLTGRLNRRSTEGRLRDIALEGKKYAVAFVDLDNFKRLNDTAGHASGDLALRHFSKVLSDVVRDQDVVGRFGGDEFLLVFPGADVEIAQTIVDRIRVHLESSFADSASPPFTASFGLADSDCGAYPAEVIARADAALLKAKRNGRNGVARMGAVDAEERPERTLTPVREEAAG
jgi:diguanylate cyclase (GGDEF)-like protein